MNNGLFCRVRGKKGEWYWHDRNKKEHRYDTKEHAQTAKKRYEEQDLEKFRKILKQVRKEIDFENELVKRRRK